MGNPPIVIHRPTQSGGRRVTVHYEGRDEILGLAHSDRDVLVFLTNAGVDDPELVLDNPMWVEWRGGRAHSYEAA
ncbi:hypothetical protein [uncultured Streptomyces sp.]|uniref:hypothetical protein n=1 Tax=uncultured Streptomyces sp. TaxID=174707 RepID=UPI0026097D52|nr:hypothetical protein [uncultured Streptomyces sp.]